MIENILENLGFSKEETETYLTLLETGSTTAGDLAKKISIPRSSLYGFLKRLSDRGLATQSVKNGKKLFTAEPPETLDTQLEEQRMELQKKQRLFQDILPDLKKLRPSNFLVPKFQLFEGEAGVKHVLKDMLLYRDLETQAFWPIQKMIEVLGEDFFRSHNKERIRRNLYTRAIWPKQSAVAIDTHPYLGVGDAFKREIRIAPKEIDFSMGYWLYGDKAAFISSRKESFGFMIESAELTEMLRTQFEILWAMSKTVPASPASQTFIEEIERHS